MQFRTFLLLLLAVCVSSTNIHNDKSGKCKTCDFLAKMMHTLWGDKVLDECMGPLLTYMCTNLDVEDHFVCQGMSSNFKEEFIYIAGKLIITPEEICSIFVKDCGESPLNKTSNWLLPIPGNKPPVVDVTVKPNQPTLQVLHLTDLHIDTQYEVGSEADCNVGEKHSGPLPLQCCRPLQDPNEVTDPKKNHTNIRRAAGKWGSYGMCDTPYWTVENMLQDIQKRVAKKEYEIAYVVVSGDLENHAEWTYTHEGHIAMIHNVSSLIRSYLPGVNVYFTIGNHEGVPIDNFAPRWTPAEFQPDWLYDAMADAWKGWITDEEEKMLKYNGCYMTKPAPGLRLISLNTGLGESRNFYMFVNQTDPDGSMSWFIRQLEDAEKAGDKVQVIGHIPGGGGDALEGWSINYYNAINRFESTVVGQFFGHTHSEQFYLSFENPNDSKSRPTGVIYSAPSVTPNYNFNPTYRVYTLDGGHADATYQILDWSEYFLNLTTANAHTEDPEWEMLYQSVKQEYSLESLTPAAWNDLLTRMEKDDALFQRYYHNFFRRSDVGRCEGECQRNLLCTARKLHHNDHLCSEDTVKVPTLSTVNEEDEKEEDLRRSRLAHGLLERYARSKLDDACPL